MNLSIVAELQVSSHDKAISSYKVLSLYNLEDIDTLEIVLENTRNSKTPPLSNFQSSVAFVADAQPPAPTNSTKNIQVGLT